VPDWAELIAEAVTRTVPVVRAETYIKSFPTASRPVLVRCDDDNDYVVKGRQAGRMIVTDHVVGAVGQLANAPVGEPVLVDVPDELVAAEPEMAHVAAGLAHGSRWIPNCGERESIEHCSSNRERFSQLALLYGWTCASDHQFIYENEPPNRVHSVDHGHFFPGSQNWTVATLKGAPAPVADDQIVRTCGLVEGELDAARRTMRVGDERIAEAVAAIPGEWGITPDEREAVADFLATRRDVLFPAQDEEEDE
jgi:hypothetical protein